MSEGLLTILKFCFLALLYLFLLRVVRVVVLELRAPAVDQAVAAEPARPAGVNKNKERRGVRLRIVEPATREGEAFVIDGEVTVGRAPGCGVVLAGDTFVSQVHARLFRRDRDTFVEDLGSTNGTFVNGERIDAATRLRRGDRVQFGQTVAEVAR
jgi:hypothetical protein